MAKYVSFIYLKEVTLLFLKLDMENITLYVVNVLKLPGKEHVKV